MATRILFHPHHITALGHLPRLWSLQVGAQPGNCGRGPFPEVSTRVSCRGSMEGVHVAVEHGGAIAEAGDDSATATAEEVSKASQFLRPAFVLTVLLLYLHPLTHLVIELFVSLRYPLSLQRRVRRQLCARI